MEKFNQIDTPTHPLGLHVMMLPNDSDLVIGMDTVDMDSSLHGYHGASSIPCTRKEWSESRMALRSYHNGSRDGVYVYAITLKSDIR